MSVTVDTRDLGRITLVSAYAHQGDSWGSDSPASCLMHSILAPLTEEGTRVIMGGDFNTGPYAMQQWLDQHGYPFHVTAQEQDTYLTAQGRSNIDYFIVSADLRGVLYRPQIVVLSGLAGHKPVRRGGRKPTSADWYMSGSGFLVRPHSLCMGPGPTQRKEASPPSE